MTGVPKVEEPKDFTKKVYFPESRPLPALESKIFEEDEEYEETTPVMSKRELPSVKEGGKTQLAQIDSENEDCDDQTPAKGNEIGLNKIDILKISSIENLESNRNLGGDISLEKSEIIKETDNSEVQNDGFADTEPATTERLLVTDRHNSSPHDMKQSSNDPVPEQSQNL